MKHFADVQELEPLLHPERKYAADALVAIPFGKQTNRILPLVVDNVERCDYVEHVSTAKRTNSVQTRDVLRHSRHSRHSVYCYLVDSTRS